MYWKKFKGLSKKEKNDESMFIVGIDLGNSTSAIAFFDVNRNTTEIIDLSGGYGKPTVPTVMQYISETKEWIFGEYAILNQGSGKDITLTSFIDKLGNKEYVEIDMRPVSIVNVLAIYLKELIGSVKNINPKGEIVGIIVSVPSYLGEDAKEELLMAFNIAGYDKEVIELVPDRLCIFSHYYFEKKVTSETVMIIDFGSRELRGGVYDVQAADDDIMIKSVSSLFDKNLGTDRVDETVSKMITQLYCLNTSTTPNKISTQNKEQISTFVYQHKDLFFQKNITSGQSSKPIRLYFNFAYPPFQQNVTKSEIEELTLPLKNDFISFINNVLEKNVYGGSKKIFARDINTVLCTGGGFEMLWVRQIINHIFPDSNKVFYKNSKGIIAEGAAIVAASKLDVIGEKKYITEDQNQIDMDIGLKVIRDRREKFVSVIERNSFWWQHYAPRMVILNKKTKGPISLTLYKRSADGDVSTLYDLALDGLPERPRGTTKIKISLQFQSYNELTATITDCGFGELFPKVDYERKFVVSLG